MSTPVALNEDSVPDDLVCSICTTLPLDPVITPCDHIFCRGCIARALQDRDLCPIDRRPCRIDQVGPLRGALFRIWSSIQVKCGCHDRGCAWSGPIGDHAAHARRCNGDASREEEEEEVVGRNPGNSAAPQQETGALSVVNDGVASGERGQRRRGAVGRAQRAARQRRPARVPQNAAARRRPAAPESLREMRAERRGLLQQLEEARRRAEAAEMGREDAESRARVAEEQRDAAINASINSSEPVVYDLGITPWQNVWDQRDVSPVLKFHTNKSVTCDSVEVNYSGSSMPGVHTLGAIDRGQVTQAIWVKGTGCTLVGLVASDEAKAAVRRCAGEDFERMPLMTSILTAEAGDCEEQGDVFHIVVDMVSRRAELFVSKRDTARQLQPDHVWEGIPEKVWIAVAFKRNTKREAVLMPCNYCDQRNINGSP